jgi:hypothetical protein
MGTACCSGHRCSPGGANLRGGSRGGHRKPRGASSRLSPSTRAPSRLTRVALRPRSERNRALVGGLCKSSSELSRQKSMCPPGEGPAASFGPSLADAEDMSTCRAKSVVPEACMCKGPRVGLVATLTPENCSAAQRNNGRCSPGGAPRPNTFAAGCSKRLKSVAAAHMPRADESTDMPKQGRASGTNTGHARNLNEA